MNHFSHLRVLGLSLCLTFGLVACKPGETDKPATEDTQKAPQESVNPSPTTSPVEQTAEGELRNVNVEAMTFALRDASGVEKAFTFTPTTRISGATGGVQGLASKQGSRVKVSYIAQGDTNSATSIEVMEKEKAAK
jgi:hypothetical protein